MTAPPPLDAAQPAAPPLPPPLPANDAARLTLLLGRALARRCPYCGGGGIFAGWLSLEARCPTCGTSFEREEGYFLGAYALNLIFAEFVGLGLALVLLFGTRLRALPLGWQMVVAGALALVLPIVFFPFSRTVWMAMDLQFDRSADARDRSPRGGTAGHSPSRRG